MSMFKWLKAVLLAVSMTDYGDPIQLEQWINKTFPNDIRCQPRAMMAAEHLNWLHKNHGGKWIAAPVVRHTRDPKVDHMYVLVRNQDTGERFKILEVSK